MAAAVVTRRQGPWKPLNIGCAYKYKGSFVNYVSMFLAFFDQLSTLVNIGQHFTDQPLMLTLAFSNPTTPSYMYLKVFDETPMIFMKK